MCTFVWRASVRHPKSAPRDPACMYPGKPGMLHLWRDLQRTNTLRPRDKEPSRSSRILDLMHAKLPP